MRSAFRFDIGLATMAKVLITGANGFAGPYVATALMQRGWEVHGLSHTQVEAGAHDIEFWHIADLKDVAAIAEAVAAARPDAVVHLAAISNVAHYDVAEIYASNVLGTRNLLHVLAERGAMAGPTVIASSGNIYGNRAGGALQEDSLASPRSDYALSKVACEYLADMYADRVHNIVIRPFNYTGRGQSLDFVIPKIIDHVRKRKKKIALGNLDIARDFSDVRFFAEMVARLLIIEIPSGERINICSGTARTLMEILEMVSKISGHQLEIVSDPLLMRKNDVVRLWGDPAKLRRLIGPFESPPLENTLRWMLD
jgi:GDP-6-deoxy-D-talose 4-dehydrogenase